jgi:hypothetical protein
MQSSRLGGTGTYGFSTVAITIHTLGIEPTVFLNFRVAGGSPGVLCSRVVGREGEALEPGKGLESGSVGVTFNFVFGISFS